MQFSLISYNCICICFDLSIVLVVCLFCILYVTNLASWLQDFNKLTYLLTYFAVELFTGPTVQSRHHLRTVSTTAEGTPFWEPWTRRSVTSDMQRLRKTFTYLFTYTYLK